MKQAFQSRVNPSASVNGASQVLCLISSPRFNFPQHGSQGRSNQLGIPESGKFCQTFEDFTVGSIQANSCLPCVWHRTVYTSTPYVNDLYGYSVAGSNFSGDSYLPHRLVWRGPFPHSISLGERYACIWPQPLPPSRDGANDSPNLPRFRTSGVRTSARRLSSSRPINSQVSNLRSLREDRFPSREKTARHGTHSALAKNSLIKFSRSATNALVMLLGAPPSISPASLGGGSVFSSRQL